VQPANEPSNKDEGFSSPKALESQEKKIPNRAEIESARHTRAQLAAWGVPWPPSKGWKIRLLVEAGELAPLIETDEGLDPVDRVKVMRAEIGLGALAEFDGWWYKL